MPTQYCFPRIASPGLTQNPLLNSRGGCYTAPDGGPSMYLSVPTPRAAAAARSGEAIVARARLSALRGAPMVGASLGRGSYAGYLTGLRGLSALGTTTDTQTNSQLSTLLQQLRVPERVAGDIDTVIQVLNGVSGAADLISTFMTDEGLRTAFRWFAFALSPGGRTPPGISDSDVNALADFCQNSRFIEDEDTQDSLITGLSSIIGAAFGGDAGDVAYTVVSTMVGFFVMFRGEVCSAPRIRRELDRRTGTGLPAATDVPAGATAANFVPMFRIGMSTFDAAAAERDRQRALNDMIARSITPDQVRLFVPPPPAAKKSFIARNRVPLTVGVGVLALGFFLL